MKTALTASAYILLIALTFCSERTATPGVVHAAPAPAAQSAGIQLQRVVTSGIAGPIFVGNAGDGSNRLFIVEQGGLIKVLQPGSSSPSLFLDITTKVMAGGEQGLLGLAFHPQYASNGRFFVNYTRKPDGATVVAEYHVSANPNVADTAEVVLLTVAQPFANHNGGMMAFGPDDFLYVALGDGGAGNDPGNRAQNINELLGKILRIDVDTPNGPVPYSSPSSNPFFGATPGADEIFAVGMRNPWRFSFDRGTGDLYVGDVGQGAWEEVDIVTLGGNYGWRIFEGAHCTGLDPLLCGGSGFTGPITEYAHAAGRCSITGGYVYRGSLSSLPTGAYVYADFCTGEIFLLDGGIAGVILDTTHLISSFGEDEAGEIYVVAISGQIFRIVSAPPPPPCNPAISPTSQNVGSNAVTGSVSVNLNGGCAWSATSNSPWITITSGSSGTGSGTVNYSVASNKSGTSPRSGTLTIAGLVFTINQAAPGGTCTFSLLPTGQAFGVSGGSNSFRLSESGTCPWNAISNAPWITITSGASGIGSGTVRYSVAPNSGPPRQGTIIAQTQFFNVTQDGTACTFSLNPLNASFAFGGGTGNVAVTATAGCNWTAVSNAAWITVTSGASGSGNGTVGYSVGANPNGTPRSGSITIAGQSFTINQAAGPCSFSISPASASFSFNGGTGSVMVTAPIGCNWTAASNDPWIVITSGAGGSGNGTVNYSVGGNPGEFQRSGTMTIAGKTFDVTQSGAPPCSYSINPSDSSFGAGGGTGSFSLSTIAGCLWTATSNASWIVVTSGGSGSASGTVNYSVGANSTLAPRSGTISITGHAGGSTIIGPTFTVNQAAGSGGCGFSISPLNAKFGKSGGTGTVAVTANSGCSWTAIPGVSWITISSGAKGTGNGTVTYSVAVNPSGVPRSGTITIAGLTFTVSQ